MRGFFRKVHNACQANRLFVPDIQDGWCNFAHIHLDWKNYGNFSRKARGLFLHELARRFSRFADALSRQNQEFQLWLFIFPYDSGYDSLYYHSKNPHSAFPCKLDDFTWDATATNLFTALLPGYTIVEGKSEDGSTLAYYAQGIGVPLA